MHILEGDIDPVQAGIAKNHILMTEQRPDNPQPGNRFVAQADGTWSEQPIPADPAE